MLECVRACVRVCIRGCVRWYFKVSARCMSPLWFSMYPPVWQMLEGGCIGRCVRGCVRVCIRQHLNISSLSPLWFSKPHCLSEHRLVEECMVRCIRVCIREHLNVSVSIPDTVFTVVFYISLRFYASVPVRASRMKIRFCISSAMAT